MAIELKKVVAQERRKRNMELAKKGHWRTSLGDENVLDLLKVGYQLVRIYQNALNCMLKLCAFLKIKKNNTPYIHQQ